MGRQLRFALVTSLALDNKHEQNHPNRTQKLRDTRPDHHFRCPEALDGRIFEQFECLKATDVKNGH